jgi:hypothetical protein
MERRQEDDLIVGGSNLDPRILKQEVERVNARALDYLVDVRALGQRTDRFAKALAAIRQIADGRRHYDRPGQDCFRALGDVRDLCDQALRGTPWAAE